MRRATVGLVCVLALAACQKQGDGPAPDSARPAPRAAPPKAYLADGGADDFHGAGTICDLSKPFAISGGGVTVAFTPTNPSEGTYTYKGTLRGFAVAGAGTYEVVFDPKGPDGEIKARGPGSVKTPMGVMTNNGGEKYTLKPTQPCP
jgi:hypothetical protein